LPTAREAISPSSWLTENGPRELEQLFRAVVFHHSSSILVADNNRNYREASVGAARLLGVPREKLLGHQLDDFAEPAFKPIVSQLWQDFLNGGEQEGVLRLLTPDGSLRQVEYTAKGNILPVCHVLALRDKAASEHAGRIQPWVQDHALYLLDTTGAIAAWYAGASRIYGYSAEEATGRHISFLYQEDESLRSSLDEELQRSSATGHVGAEGWQVRQDGSSFWANTITMALKDEAGRLHGFARLVRDFSDRHEQDEKLRRARRRLRPVTTEAAIAGIASGEFDHVPEVNDTFLDLVGYTREELVSGDMPWPDLTPVEYAPLDDLAHEECLRFGACAPYEKELMHKDGARVPVLVTTAVLKLSPFRWVSFFQDLRERNRFESIGHGDPDPAEDFEEIVGVSAALRRVQQQVEVVAPTDATVLILGETGTGKELVARALHRMSTRRNMPFVTLNCAAIPTGLLESELFGYERGAFTGALSQKIGRFEMANHGTLFLDEVGDIPLDLQPKLLRALQEKSFERLGGVRTIPIDVRLVAATNRNLTEMMGDKLFRSDLYYRLKVFPVTTPPLRDRPEDIPVLARHFTRKYAEIMGRQIDKIPTETLRALVDWRWPGNVRELENFIERSVILSVGPTLRAPISEIREAAGEPQANSTLEQVEREHILRILRETNGVVTAAAARLGLHRTTLNAMMSKLGISRKDI
jgi:PAS domain S-box-containing protein